MDNQMFSALSSTSGVFEVWNFFRTEDNSNSARR